MVGNSVDDRVVVGGKDEGLAAIVAVNALPPSYFVSLETAALHQMIDASKEALERAHAEMHVIAEFASKIAEAHTVAGVAKAYEDCIQHQADILRQDGESILKRSTEILGRVSEIVSSYWPRPPLP